MEEKFTRRQALGIGGGALEINVEQGVEQFFTRARSILREGA